jgi:hypothetical protein
MLKKLIMGDGFERGLRQIVFPQVVSCFLGTDDPGFYFFNGFGHLGDIIYILKS